MKVFYINTELQDGYYVRAENADKAVRILKEAISKFYFMRTLADDQSMPSPAMLGDNIIVGHHVRENGMNGELWVEDITIQAYGLCQTGEEHWCDWNITEEDTLCQE